MLVVPISHPEKQDRKGREIDLSNFFLKFGGFLFAEYIDAIFSAREQPAMHNRPQNRVARPISYVMTF